MAKTVPIDDDAHALVTEKQSEIKEKYNISLKLSHMVSLIVKEYVHKMEDILKKEIGKISKRADTENNTKSDSAETIEDTRE